MTNWPTKKLGDCLAQFDRGISWSRKDEGGNIAVLRIPNIQEGHINLDDLKYISVKNGSGELFKNDIVMVASNGNPDLVGRSALVTEKEGGMRFASFLIRLRLDNTKLLSQYAHLFLLTPAFKRELRRKIATTSGIYNLKKEHIEKIKIPLPPLKIQKQIVERLDKIAEARKLNDELIQKSDELFQSLLHQELNPAGKDWRTDLLENIIKDISDGNYSSKYPRASEFVKNGVPFVRANNFLNGLIAWDDMRFITPQKHKELAKGHLKTNDILIVTRGETGNVALVSKEFDDANINAQIVRLNSGSASTNFFLFYVFQTDWVRRRVRALTTGTTLKQLPVGNLRKIKISLPPLETQKQIVAKLSAVQEYKTQLLGQRVKFKELFDSALHKSMNQRPH